MEDKNKQQEHCGCGTEHHEHEHHEHEHEEVCGCGHDHKHDHHDHVQSVAADDLAGINAGQTVYILENLGCANCAAKMEAKIRQLPEVQGATITFATKQLRVAADQTKDLLPKLQEICQSIESEVVVVPRIEAEQTAKANKSKKHSENRREMIQIGIGAVLFAAGKLLEGNYELLSTIIFVCGYLILGGKILVTAGKNLLKGHVFDENFLMSLATLAAFVIGDYAEAVGVMMFYRVGELFEHIAVERSRSQIMDAVDLRPEVVNRMEDQKVSSIPAAEAKVGDILLVRPGDRIPLDGVVTEGESRVDTSPVTGEPVPVKVEPGKEVISGCVNTSGTIYVKVTQTLENSMVTRILNSVENAAASKPKLDRFITRFARVYTPVVVLIALATAIIPSLITGDWNHYIYTAITFLVISCPCALVLSVPLAFFSGIGAGSKKGILFKGGVALEGLTNIKAVLMDKTGTITKGDFVVQDIVTAGDTQAEEILKVAAKCESASTHPIGNSIVQAAKIKGYETEGSYHIEEISGKGIKADIDGHNILCGNRLLLQEAGVNLTEVREGSYGTRVYVASDGVFMGYLVIADTVKEDSAGAISDMKRQGIQTAMLTGDAKASSQQIAEQVKVDEVFAELLPEEKLSKLKELRESYGPVMYVGDGINDAPVLAGADVGAAMGSGADAAIEAADVVFMTSSVQAIPDAVAVAKATWRIAMQNVIFALAIKALVMILGFLGYANMWMAVFADTGVAMLCVLNSIKILYKR